MITNPNDYAFPFQGREYGLTKREYFAAMAMQAIIAKESLLSEEEHLDWQSDVAGIGKPEGSHVQTYDEYCVLSLMNMSTAACCHADALIDALNEEAK